MASARSRSGVRPACTRWRRRPTSRRRRTWRRPCASWRRCRQPRSWAGQEVELQIALGTALTATRGYGSTAVETAYARAYALCENLGDADRLFAALSGLHSFYQVRGPLRMASDVAGRLVQLAERSGAEPQLAQAHRRYGWNLFCLGRMRDGKITSIGRLRSTTLRARASTGSCTARTRGWSASSTRPGSNGWLDNPAWRSNAAMWRVACARARASIAARVCTVHVSRDVPM